MHMALTFLWIELQTSLAVRLGGIRSDGVMDISFPIPQMFDHSVTRGFTVEQNLKKPVSKEKSEMCVILCAEIPGNYNIARSKVSQAAIVI